MNKLFMCFWKFFTIFMLICQLESAYAIQKNRSRINWLDSDTNILVLQNKVYKKAHNVCLDLALGQQNMSRFQDTNLLQLKGSYYVWEDWGIEFFYSIIQNTDNSSLSSLRVLTDEQPFISKINNAMGFSLLYAPFYAKINIWNNIIYFNLVSGVGLSFLDTSTNFEQYMDMDATTRLNSLYRKENILGYNVKVEFKFYITKNILLSPSVVNTFYSSKDAKEGTPQTIKNYQDYLLAIGFSI